LNGGEAAVSDEQEATGFGAVDDFDAGQGICTFGACIHIPATAAVGGDVRLSQRGGVMGGIAARAATDDVVAGAASEAVGGIAARKLVRRRVAGDDVGVGVAGDVDLGLTCERDGGDPRGELEVDAGGTAAAPHSEVVIRDA